MLVGFCTLALTLSAIISRAWSYHDYGIKLTTRSAIGFNVIVMCGIVMAWATPEIFGFWVRVMGSIIGAIGVMVCTSETLWLTKN